MLFSLQTLPGLTIGVELCEDLWAPQPPSVRLAQAGATLILNLSASDETVGKDVYRRSLVTGQSARLVCGYLYADAGEGNPPPIWCLPGTISSRKTAFSWTRAAILPPASPCQRWTSIVCSPSAAV